MKARKNITLCLFSALLALTAPLTLGHDESPSGTVVIDETQVMLLVGGDSGKGTLVRHNDGDVRHFKVDGVKLGGIGIHKKHITGTVYHMQKEKDFEGTYFLAEAGITVVEGKSGMWLQNNAGVTMHLVSGNEGVALSLGIEGLKVKFVK